MAYAGVWLLAGVILGSVTGAATATFLAPRQPGLSQESSSEFAARVAASVEQAAKRAVERVRDEMEAARTEPANAATSDGPRVTVDPAPAGSSRRPPRETEPESAAGDGAPVVRDAYTPLREKNAARLELLVVRSPETKAARRRDWLFVGERAVSVMLGAPDSVVQQKDGRETWRYGIPFSDASGKQDAHSLELTFARGRVVDISGAEDIPEDR